MNNIEYHNSTVQKIHEIIINPCEKRDIVNHVNIYKNYLMATDCHMAVYIHESLIPDHAIICNCMIDKINANKNLALENPSMQFSTTYSELINFFELYKKTDFDHRVQFFECEECQGDGYIECDECNHQRDCSNCHTTGQVSLQNHDGFYEPKPLTLFFKIGNHYFDGLLIYRALYVLKLVSAIENISGSLSANGDHLRLWCDNFTAIIMRASGCQGLKIIANIPLAKNKEEEIKS